MSVFYLLFVNVLVFVCVVGWVDCVYSVVIVKNFCPLVSYIFEYFVYFDGSIGGLCVSCCVVDFC